MKPVCADMRGWKTSGRKAGGNKNKMEKNITVCKVIYWLTSELVKKIHWLGFQGQKSAKASCATLPPSTSTPSSPENKSGNSSSRNLHRMGPRENSSEQLGSLQLGHWWWLMWQSIKLRSLSTWVQIQLGAGVLLPKLIFSFNSAIVLWVKGSLRL